MTRQTAPTASNLLPHHIVALGVQPPDDEKAFLVANASYRAIQVLGSALNLGLVGVLLAIRQTPARKVGTAA